MTTLGEPVAKMSKEVGDEYSSSLADLTMNSKPLINMLTILAEESIDHAPVIVKSVEKHLDKVRPDIKLPVLYLVDSIIKNVGGAYTQLFAQIIVNMFLKVFKQVDEKTRSQMFKLRETWHDVFPSTKLYQLDVKVNMVDPAWPIQARPPQSNIHVNPNFLNRAVSSSTAAVGSSTTAPVTAATALSPEEIKMREAVARKEQELLRLQKIQMELAQKEKELMEQRKALEKKAASQQILATVVSTDVVPPAITTKYKPVATTIAVQQPAPLRIAPVNPALVNTARRRDPRLSRQQTTEIQPPPVPLQETPAVTVVTRKEDPRIPRKPDIPQLTSPSKQDKSPTKSSHKHLEKRKERIKDQSDIHKSSRISKLQPIPKIKPTDRHVEKQVTQVSPNSSPTKRKKEIDSPRSHRKHKKSKESLPKEDAPETKIQKKSSLEEGKKVKTRKHEQESEKQEATMESFKEMKRRSKERNYIRRNREKSESPEGDVDLRTQPQNNTATTVPESVSNGASGDVDLRTLTTNIVPQLQRKRSPSEGIQHEPNKKSKSGKLDELFGNEDVDLRKLPIADDSLSLPKVDNVGDKIKSPPPVAKTKSSDKKDDRESNEEDEEMEESSLGNIKDVEGGWAKVKEIQSPQVVTGEPSLSHLDVVRAKLAKATKKDGLGRLKIFSSSDDVKEKKKGNSKDTDMRLKNKSQLEGNSLDSNIKIIMSQAEEQLQSGNINKDQYNVLLMQVLHLNERQKLKEAKQKESLEASKRKLHWLQQKKTDSKSGDEARERSTSPESERSTDSPLQSLLGSTLTPFGDIDERVPPTIILPSTSVDEGTIKQKDSDMRVLNQISDKRSKMQPRPDINMSPHPGLPSGMPMPIPDMNMMHPVPDMNMPLLRPDMNMPMPRPDGMFPGGAPWPPAPRTYGPRGFRGPRPRNEEWGGPRGFRGRGPVGNWRMPGGNRPMMDMPDRMPMPNQPFLPVEPRAGLFLGPNPVPRYVRDDRSSPPPLGMSTTTKEYARINPAIFEYMQRDTMKSISIDGVNREIRFYKTTAIVLLDWDDPREIFFQPGQRKIYIDDKVMSLRFGEDYETFTVDGIVHRIKFGAPTRELFIDDMWFECFFGGPPIPILLDGKVRLIKLDGPPPQVTIGDDKRTDLCAGKINMIIDAINMVPVFLDAKPQLVDIGGVSHSLRFVDALETVLINEKPYKVEFGGLPKPLTVNKKKHFVRFTVLPRTVRAGAVHILNMEGKKPDPVPVQPTVTVAPTPATTTDSEKSSLGNLDILASLLPSSVAPSSQVGSYSAATDASTTQQSEAVPQALQNVDITSLFAKLVATGILQNPAVTQQSNDSAGNYSTVTKSEETKPEEIKEVPPAVNKPSPPVFTTVKTVDLKKTETLKVKQPGLVNILHSGMQCGSCGARFPPEHTTRYSQHLDWHFRQNRAEKDSQRRPHSRRWYYDISDWVQFEEIEDLEEREKSWFERQQEEGAAVEASEAIPSIQEEVSVVAPPPTAPPNQFKCGHCGDPFHQFYNQELEEWQLRKAVTYEDNNYHPDCLEEYKVALSEKTALESNGGDETIASEKEEDTTVKDNDWEEDEEMKSADVEDQEVEEQNVSEEMEDEESVVEVLSEKSQEEEVELVDDDDVVIKTEPVVEITVEDADTDEETEKERAARDEQYELDFSKIKIKQEPVDPDDEPVITSEQIVTTHADTTHAAVISSIDGNVQLQPATVQSTAGPALIRINITKPLVPASSTPPHKPTGAENADQENSTIEDAPEVEPEYTIKSSLQGAVFTKYPPTIRGNELSGLCSLM